MTVQVNDPEDFNTTFAGADIADFENGLRGAEPFFQRITGNHINVEKDVKVDNRQAIIGDLNFDYGIPPSVYKPLAEACRKFSWKKFNNELQLMGQHKKVTIQGNDVFDGEIDVHFVHRPSKDGKPRKAIILIHGWPGSFQEFKGVAPLLDEAGYDLVIPSLPGYVYSSSPPQHNGGSGTSPWTITKTATCFDAIMQKLGYSQYFAQGGDWGALVSRRIAQLFPQRCIAIHINFLMIHPSQHPTEEQKKDMTKEEVHKYDRYNMFLDRGLAYAEMQGTTPYTLGAALSSHPIAGLVYLTEKFLRWSDPETRPPLDDIIGNVALYWLNNKITSSFWFYYNLKLAKGDNAECCLTKSSVPTGICIGREEIYSVPKFVVDPVMNIKSWGYFSKGGHFMALEQPELFAKEVANFFSQY